MSTQKVEGDPKFNIPQEKEKKAGELSEGKKKVTDLGKENDVGSCDWKSIARWMAVAFAVLAFAAGTGGLLVYIGQLKIGLASVGMLTEPLGLYILLAGYGLTFITGVLVLTSCYLSRKQGTDDAGQKSWFSCNWCKKTDAPVSS